MSFYNPYHFIPTDKRSYNTHDIPVATVDNKLSVNWGNHSHDRYGQFSGRLVCKLTTDSPVFIGAKQIDSGPEHPKLIKPFELEDGKPAIPATTLRGIIASIVEAASNSALRVLDRKRELTYRVGIGTNDVLSAMGMIIRKGEKLYLLPLAMPTLELEDGKYIFKGKMGLKKVFQNNPRMKSYISSKEKNADTKGFCYLKSDEWDLENIAENDVRLRHPSKKTGYYINKANPSDKLNEKDWRKKNKNEYYAEKEPNPVFVIGQKHIKNSLLTEKAYLDTKPNGFVRGFLRTILDRGKVIRKDIPGTVYHTLFIPYPVNVEESLDNIAIPLSQNAIEIFNALSDERTIPELDEDGNPKNNRDALSLHPYNPLGTRRNTVSGKEKHLLRLKQGDLVYFDVNDKGTEVTRVSFSSIWRNTVGKVEKFFGGIDDELLPFSASRKTISPAELIFGFTQEEQGTNTQEEQGANTLAFKGKVRISNGLLGQDQSAPYYLYGKAQLIKILGSPKPPCPTLYFRNKTGNKYIAKNELDPEYHEPQGRKDYLRKSTDQAAIYSAIDKKEKHFWQTENDEKHLSQKVKIDPIRPGKEFWFHIDFENLSEWELALLCFAVKPNKDYRHKIGMGKAIELGQVNIEPAGLYLVNRGKRYSPQGLPAGRYWKKWGISALPGIYKHELSAEETSETVANYEQLYEIFTTDAAYQKQIYAIRLIGNPAKTNDHKVHTPQVMDNGRVEPLEKETFRWFVKNTRQQLAPIEKEKPLPTLEYLQK